MRRLVVVGIALGLISCTGSSGPTNPAPVPTTTSVVQSAPAPEATPQPVVAEPTIGGPGPVSYEGHKCEGSLFNRAPHSRTVHVRYTAPLDNSTIYLETTFLVQGKSHKAVPSAQAVFEAEYDIPEPSCDPWGWAKRVQCDFTAGQGEHLAGQFVDVALSVPAIEDEPIGDPIIERDLVCGEEIHGSGDRCWLNCLMTITHTQKFTCSDPTVETKEKEHRKPVDCPVICAAMNKPPTDNPILHALYFNQYGNNPTCGDLGFETLWTQQGAGDTPAKASSVIVKDGQCRSGANKHFAKQARRSMKTIPAGWTPYFLCGDTPKAVSHTVGCGCPIVQ